MSTPTYDLLASTTLGSATRTVTLSSIPSTYRDLVLVSTVTVVGGTDTLCLQFNSDTSSAYNGVTMEGNGSSAASGNQTNNNKIMASMAEYAVSNQVAVFVSQIFDYSTTDKHKMVLTRGGAANVRVAGAGGRWANTAAINSISIFTDSASRTWAAGSSFYLYGIAG